MLLMLMLDQLIILTLTLTATNNFPNTLYTFLSPHS
jgi:hypothetical protein